MPQCASILRGQEQRVIETPYDGRSDREVYQLYISTRMRRGVPGPPGNSRAAISTKSTKATNAKSESTIPLHGAGAKTSIGPQPNFRVFGIKQKYQSSLDSKGAVLQWSRHGRP